jgi:hypothetical protein
MSTGVVGMRCVDRILTVFRRYHATLTPTAVRALSAAGSAASSAGNACTILRAAPTLRPSPLVRLSMLLCQSRGSPEWQVQWPTGGRWGESVCVGPA